VQGFLNLNKPTGLTSHDCVARVRRLLKLRRVGHGGTLDPAATGVLPIALGKATRLLQYLHRDKMYRATVLFGLRTTTDDLEGEALTKGSVPWLDLAAIEAVLGQFQGKIQQIPPSYSAIQVQGKRLYELARAGELVQVPARTVDVYQIDVLDWRPGNFPELDLAIACGTGTYIRAIARDLGDILGTGATLAALTRTKSSGFSLADSLTLEELSEQVQHRTFEPIPPDVGLAHLPAMLLTPSQAKQWCQGQRLLLPNEEFPADSTSYRVHHKNDQFLGVGQLIQTTDGPFIIPKLVFDWTLDD
jgi:tRNA pseudouridine55 synthase